MSPNEHVAVVFGAVGGVLLGAVAGAGHCGARAGAVVGLIWFALFAEVLSENVRRQRAEEREAQVRDAQRVLARDKAQTALDAAYAKAEEQALAAAEVGQGWSMPSREQCAAAAYDGTHERLLMTQADRALEVALLESHLNARSRPPITADTDPDGSPHAW